MGNHQFTKGIYDMISIFTKLHCLLQVHGLNRDKLEVGTSVKLVRKTEKESAHFSQKKAMHKG